ncbi:MULTISPECIES: peroxidase family protein [Alphaproteobacteria]|uniref:peroxidase family protein n=1 Tax=Alphaproteobacteria TaxID=28211 RepID=UPI001C97A55F|nr:MULTISPECIES: peroxidase family protein [Alphaproteobacteria]MBY5999731.1 hypothetical protein [Tritonibacter mobilis]
MAVKLNKHDLEFILKQIKIAEAHSAGTPLTDMIVQPHLPYGLRTVDGTYNNILPGRELWGAADQTMPRMFDPYWRDEADGDSFDPDGPTQPAPPIVDGNYDSGGETPSTGGSIADADPRIISNLIADQTPNNPAALIAALRHAGHEGDLTAKMASITEPFALIHALKVANARVDSWQKTLDDVEAAIQAATDAGQSPSPDLIILKPALEGNLAAAQTAAAAALQDAEAHSLPNVDDDGDPGTAPVTITGAQNVLDHVASQLGIEFEIDGTSLKLPNVAPDEGLSAPFNGWMTFFGQFFDHGLDLISKGGDGTIYVPLEPDDPLYVPGGFTNFMVLTRATQVAGPGADGVLGTADDTQREAINVTTPFVDQNQTYTSHPSHQVFLREYTLVDGKPLATGRLLDGADGGLPTWADIKSQAKNLLGIELTDRDVFNIPMVRTDLYGEFIRDPDTGFAQVIIGLGPDGIPNTDDDITMSGTPGDPVKLNPHPSVGGTEPIRTSHSFLDDIAHNAVPVLDTEGLLITDGDDVPGVDPAGNAVQFDPLTGRNTEYDNELLDRHFITGDGRGNENFGLTAVHHVFHSEHNRQVVTNKLEILKTGDLEFINEWLLNDITQDELDAVLAGMTGNLEHYLSGADLNGVALSWDGERLFQTARFATEMQYQHLVFEEFGRKVQPMIDVFVFNTITDIDPAIFAEFAHVVYRFGHSMLTEEITRLFLNTEGEPIRYENGTAVAVEPAELGGWGQDTGLIEAFLNPVAFDMDGVITHDQAAGAIFRGMSLVHGNEIDEFIVDALRTNLLGLPLDLAAINIARGRDAGMPSLNQAREQLYEASNSTFVKPYASWADFAGNLKTPASVINFIAAYGKHPTLTSQVETSPDSGQFRDKTMQELREAATLLVMGGSGAPTDRLAFLNSTGAWNPENSGLNEIDMWIGGLAEKKMPFGGMLGSTFNAVFEAQLEMLQDLDRFYYLTRTQGLNLLNELENNAFSKMIAANSDMIDPGADGIRGTADDGEINFPTGIDPFAKHDYVLNIDPDKQIEADPEHDDAALNAMGMTKVQRDDFLTDADEAATKNYIRFIGGEHTVIAGSANDDTIIADYGDDAIWGGAGNDRIEGGAGVDFILGGAGDDIITDSGDSGDFIKGEDGDDVIANSNGLDVLMGGDGKDVFLVGVDGTEVFGGEGDDFILGGADIDFLMGNEGDDWIEGGDGFDTLAGDNSELFFNSTIKGHDVLFAGENENDFDAESGDDIMVQGESVMRNEGMFGFDWAIHKGSRVAADSDMRIPIFTNVADDILRDRFDQTEGLSGWIYNDTLRGDDRGDGQEIEAEFDMTNHELTQAGVNRIAGLAELLGDLVAAVPEDYAGDFEDLIAFKAGNILIGGDGSDVIEGRGGDDFIHGDAWLNVRIRLVDVGAENTQENEIATVDTLTHVFTEQDAGDPSWEGKALSELLLSGTIKPSQMHIVREIKYDEDPTGDVDTAVFAGNRDWYEITQLDGGIIKVARREMEEIDPQISEGTDTLVGIERIQFADQIVTIRQTGNVDPTGRLIISGMPATEGNPLTVSAAQIYDLNNPDGVVTNISYRWQVERNDGTGDYVNIANVSGDSFTPDDAHVGLRIRVIGTYIDGGGVIETVTSAPTDVVIGLNDTPVGPLLISDMTPTEGQELTATVAFIDPDGTSDAFEESLLTYQWQYSVTGSGPWIDVPADQGGNSRSFTPAGEQVGHYIQVVVDYTDDLGFTHQVKSAVTATVGNFILSDAIEIDGASGDAEGGTTVGDDEVFGGDSANSIQGLAGADIIHGGDGDDTIDGGEGADTLDGGAGNDTIHGGAGDDIIVHAIGEGGATIDGGAGQDTLSIIDKSAGDANAEVTVSGGVINNAAGASINSVESAQLDLGSGNDTLTYGAATDSGVSVNLLAGLATGFSFIRGVENVNGSAHADLLLGNGLDNVMTGQGGDDTVRGGFGNDLLEGNGGNDRLFGEEGDDLLNGGAGDDHIDGGAGIDTASYSDAAAGVTVTLASNEQQNTSGSGNDTLIGIENLVGSGFADTLSGNGENNLIDGGAGEDNMAGGVGDDTYLVDVLGDVVMENASEGNDTVRTALSGYILTANVENLVLLDGATGGVGNASENEFTGNAADNTFDGGGGIDTVVLNGDITDYQFAFIGGGNITVTSAAGGTDTLTSIEQIKVGGITYAIASGNNASNVGAGAVSGGSGSDVLLGFNGIDELLGGAGDDILIGGAGADTMVGDVGNDTYVVNNGGDFVNETGGSGLDTIYSSVSRNLSNNQHVTGIVENLTLIGTANINGVGNGEDNVIIGNSGNNTLNGRGGNDTLVGNAGNDILNGGAGNDRLAGGAGNDTLNGRGGTDVAVFTGSAADYAFNITGTGLTSMTDLSGFGGTDTLTNIEGLAFADGASMAIVADAPGANGTLQATEASIILGGDGNDEIRGSAANDVIVGGLGDDNLFGSDLAEGDNATSGATDDDTFIWNAGDGTDTIHGGFEGPNGDTLVITGNSESETYRIYTLEEAVARIGFSEEDAGGDFEPEIVVTRQTAGEAETVISVLVEIEEIVVNGANVSGNGAAGGDTFEIYGNFDTATSLRPNTITITGTSGDDSVDISSLTSAHRIVFKTKGGNDVIVGTLRPQDVVVLPDGTAIDDYEIIDNLNGTNSLHGAGHTVTFTSVGGLPQFSVGHEENAAQNDDTQPVGNNDEGDQGGEDGIDTPPSTSVGTEQADPLIGTAIDDTIMGLGDRDVVFAGAGDDDVMGGGGADMLYGDDGNDRILGENGNDFINGGAGRDAVFGGSGDDIIVAEQDDGDDTYYGDDMVGGHGNDTLDMSAITAAITADLGTGFLGRGSVESIQTGSDTVWGIENIIAGSGNDRITASGAVNVIDGGGGEDVFRFLSAAHADGDTIIGFEPGDKIDFSAMDANGCASGNQSFTLVSDAFSGRGQLMIKQEIRDGEDYTVVEGNTTGGPDADFKLSIKGSHELNASDFNL